MVHMLVKCEFNIFKPCRFNSGWIGDEEVDNYCTLEELDLELAPYGWLKCMNMEDGDSEQ